MKKAIAGAVVSSIVAFCALNAQAEMQEGRWTFTTIVNSEALAGSQAEMEAAMADLPPEQAAMFKDMMAGLNMGAAAGGGISHTMTQCVTSDNAIPQMDKVEGCELTQQRRGDTISFESTCEDGTVSTGEITYSDQSMQGLITSRLAESGEEVTIELSGQYDGPCEE